MEFMTTQTVARILAMTPDGVRYHARRGHLLTIEVERGCEPPMRLYVREDIERFQRQREEGSLQTPPGTLHGA